MTAPHTPAGGPIARALGTARGAVDVLYREMIKFGVVGAVAFVIDLGGANLLWHTVLPDKVTTAKIISGAVATLVAWFGNRQWTFRHRRSRPSTTRSACSSASTSWRSASRPSPSPLSHYGLGFTSRLADNLATVVGIGLGTLFRFWAYRRFVFSHEPL